jgi:Protein of unknown function DUF262/Protein of unknown function (DUF1524)
MASSGRIVFEHIGIGSLLRAGRLRVPPNQRSYKWEEEHVTDLFQDLSKAIDSADYFLGTIVLTGAATPIPQVTDGQQRLATTTILLTAIRDFFIEKNEYKIVNQLEGDFLSFTEYGTKETVPRLGLNVDDSQFFTEAIIARPGERKTPRLENLSESNKRLFNALILAKKHVDDITSAFRENDKEGVLVKWIEFIRDKATVIAIRVPDATSAYRMFATLNDRGLRASQVDVLKNYLFSKSGTRETEAAARWSSMTGAIETVGDDDLLVLYIRHLWVSKYGPTKEEELAEEVENKIRGTQGAMEFLRELDESASDYVALFNPEHSKWNQYKTVIRAHVRTIYQDLKVEQIRPMLFAISRHFTPEEAVKAFRLCVSWSVRYLVAGGRGGFLDRHYGLRAQEIGQGKIKTAKQLVDAMRELLPNDTLFKEKFWKATVSQAYLARYYLKTLDSLMSGETEPEWIANPETEVVNLEHVMPKTPGDGWTIDPDIAAANLKRLGNMVLMQATKNSDVANSSFGEKRAEYKKSTFVITSSVARYAEWTSKEIDARQARLADTALLAWPIDLKAPSGKRKRS